MKSILLFTASVLTAFSVTSQTIDPTFGTNGVVVNELTTGVDALFKMKLLPDGKIVAIGIADNKIVLSRYLAHGVLDSTFGNEGIKTTNFSCHFAFRAPVDIALQEGHKIVILGLNGSNKFLARYDEDGTIDTTFGDNGIVNINADLGSNATEWCSGMKVLNDGSIIVIGTYQSLNKIFVIKYNANGDLATSFGENGYIVTTAPESYSGFYARDFCLQNDGSLVMAASVNKPTGYMAFCLLKYSADGQLDTDFATNGFGITDIGGLNVHDRPTTIELQADGKILLAGSSGVKYVVARYNTTGDLDTTFNSNGIASTSVGGSYRECADMLLEPTGKIVLAGYVGDDFATVRFKPDGTTDTAYGTNGVFKIDFGSSFDYGNTIVRQADDKFVMGGWTSHFCTDRGFGLTRFSSPLTEGNLNSPEILTIAISCFPNPTTGDFSIKLPNISEKTHVIVSNSLGQQIKNEMFYAVNSINLSLQGSAGIYLVEVTESEKKSAFFKIVKI